MIKIVLLTIVSIIGFSCTKEECKEYEKELITVEQDTTENEIEIDINIECYGSNQ